MDSSPFSVKDKLLVLRYRRLGKLPPALYATQILAENHYQVLVVEFGNLEETGAYVTGAIPRWRLSSPWARWLPSSVRAPLILLSVILRLWMRILREGKPLLMNAHGQQEHVLALVLRWLTGTRYMVQVHEGYDSSDPLSPFNRLMFRLEGAALRRAEFLVFPEVTRARIYRDRYRLTCPVFFVFNSPRLHQKGKGIDFRATLKLPADSILMAYVGGVSSTNVLQEGIQALSGLPKLHFLIWGWGDEAYLESLKAAAVKGGVENRVHLLGELESEKWESLDGCDIGYCVYRPILFRLRYAATASNKLMEYWAAGLPVLTNNADDFKRLLSEYQSGSWAPDLTPEGIRDGLHGLVYDELGLKRKAASALEAHRTRFNFEHQFDETLQHFLSKFPPKASPPLSALKTRATPDDN